MKPAETAQRRPSTSREMWLAGPERGLSLVVEASVSEWLGKTVDHGREDLRAFGRCVSVDLDYTVAFR